MSTPPSPPSWARVPSLIAAALLLLAGIGTTEGNRELAGIFLAAGLIVFGVWIALEVHAIMSDRPAPHPTKKPKGDDDGPA